MSSSGLKTTDFSVKHLHLLIFISFQFSTKPAIAYTHCCAFGVFYFRFFFQCRFCFALALEALLKALVERWLVRLLNVLTNSVGFTFYLSIPLLCPTYKLL